MTEYERLSALEKKFEKDTTALVELHLNTSIEKALDGTPWSSPFLPCTASEIIAFIKFANITHDDIILDVGCGDGRVLVSAALLRGCRGIGVDISEECIATASFMSASENISHLTDWFLSDIVNPDPNHLQIFERATVVFLYIYPTLISKIYELMLAMCKKGARVVTLQYHFENWEPHNRCEDANMNLYYLAK